METTQQTKPATTFAEGAKPAKLAHLLAAASRVPAELAGAQLEQALWVRVTLNQGDGGTFDALEPEEGPRGLYCTKTTPHAAGGFVGSRQLIPWTSIKQIQIMAVADTVEQPF